MEQKLTDLPKYTNKLFYFCQQLDVFQLYIQEFSHYHPNCNSQQLTQLLLKSLQCDSKELFNNSLAWRKTGDGWNFWANVSLAWKLKLGYTKGWELACDSFTWLPQFKHYLYTCGICPPKPNK